MGLIPGLGGGSSGGGGGGILSILSQLTDPLGLFSKGGGGPQTPGQSMQASPRPMPTAGPPMQNAGQSMQPVPFVRAMGGAGGPGGNARDLQALLALLQSGG